MWDLASQYPENASMDDLPILLFAGPAELEAWLEAGPDPAGAWLKIAKKGAPEPSVTSAVNVRSGTVIAGSGSSATPSGR